MPYEQFDRSRVRFRPLAERPSKVEIERDYVRLDQSPSDTALMGSEAFEQTVERVRAARANDRPVMLSFGAHTIKNGLGPALIRLLESGWITHLATNGAGIIHDWEFAFQGKSSEDVRANVAVGRFGNWEETGRFINLALNVGAWQGRGYGESVGAFIEEEGLTIPSRDTLSAEARDRLSDAPGQAAAAADLLALVERFELPEGRLGAPHPWKRFSVQGAAFRLGIPFTGHPMFGHDIIYNHPMNHGALLGRAAQRDFLTFAASVRRLQGGVYLSIGSAVMSPMIFEKSLSIARSDAIQSDERIDDFFLMIVDLAESRWDWSKGEPPASSPDYYLRYNKTFARMGGEMRYQTADNRDFLLALLQSLCPAQEGQP